MPAPRTSSAAAAEKIEAVHRAITALGEATADAIATQAGMAYSTVTPKLRALADDGRAEFFKDPNGKGKWRIIPAETDGTPTHPDAAELAVEDADLEPRPQPETAAPETTDSPPAETTDNTPAGVDVDSADEADITDTSDSTALTDHRPTASADTADDAPASSDQTDTEPDKPAKRPRRRKGDIPRELLAVMQNEPDTAFKVGALAERIDASAGAVANALNGLTAAGTVRLVGEDPAMYQAV